MKFDFDKILRRSPESTGGGKLPVHATFFHHSTEEEALAQLQQAAAAWETETLADCEILSREEKMTVDDGVATLTVDYLCRMDIASPKKIEVTFDEEQSEETSDSAG